MPEVIIREDGVLWWYSGCEKRILMSKTNAHVKRDPRDLFDPSVPCGIMMEKLIGCILVGFLTWTCSCQLFELGLLASRTVKKIQLHWALLLSHFVIEVCAKCNTLSSMYYMCVLVPSFWNKLVTKTQLRLHTMGGDSVTVRLNSVDFRPC